MPSMSAQDHQGLTVLYRIGHTTRVTSAQRFYQHDLDQLESRRAHLPLR